MEFNIVEMSLVWLLIKKDICLGTVSSQYCTIVLDWVLFCLLSTTVRGKETLLAGWCLLRC
jgi:hypothetical protein